MTTALSILISNTNGCVIPKDSVFDIRMDSAVVIETTGDWRLVCHLISNTNGCVIPKDSGSLRYPVDLGNTSKEIIRCFAITARFAGSHRSLRPDTARLPVQSVPVTIRQRTFSTPGVYYWPTSSPAGVRRAL